MTCYTEISSVSNTLKKFQIQSILYAGYKHNFYHDKLDKFNELFDQYHIPLSNNIDHPTLIQERRENIDAATYENK